MQVHVLFLDNDRVCIVFCDFKKLVDEFFKTIRLIQCNLNIFFLLLLRHIWGFMEQTQITYHCCQWSAYIVRQIHDNFIFLFFCLLCSLLAQQNRHFNLIELFLQFFQWLRQRYCMIVLLIDRLGCVNYFIQIAPRLFPIVIEDTYKAEHQIQNKKQIKPPVEPCKNTVVKF